MKRIFGALIAIVTMVMLNISPAMAQTGLFPACYQAVNPRIGGDELNLQLLIDAPDNTVTGTGEISNSSINPPLDVKSELRGRYSYLVFGPDTQVSIEAKGYPKVNFPPDGGLGPVILPNAELSMVLKSGFNSGGEATYKYWSSSADKFNEVNLQMESKPCFK